jgi:subfamily B ATP-binding cassette protein MsbA
VAIAATVLGSATEPMVPALLKPLLDRGFKADGELDIWLVPFFLMLLFGARG